MWIVCNKSVLLEALEDTRIDKILLISRKPLGLKNPKIEELIINDFLKIGLKAEHLKNYGAIYHRMGVSVIGLSEEKYSHFTFKITKALVDTLFEINPKMVFVYVSGQGTDSTEKGRIIWARVKGKAENYILNQGFKDAYMIRLGALLPEKGIRSKTIWYQVFYDIKRPFFPLFKRFDSIVSTTSFGKALLKLLFYPSAKKHLENRDLHSLMN